MRVIGSSQVTFAITCGSGFYAPDLVGLATPPIGTTDGFIQNDLGSAVTVVKSGYSIQMESTPFGGAPDTCNGLGGGETGQAFRAAADPLDAPTTTAISPSTPATRSGKTRRPCGRRCLRPAIRLLASRSSSSRAIIPLTMWTKMMGGPRKKAPKTIAVIDPDRCFGAFACSICQAACPVAGCIVEEPDRDGRMVCAVRADLCIGCGLCVTLGNPTAPQQREFGCPADYDAINMMPFEEVVKLLTAEEPKVEATT